MEGRISMSNLELSRLKIITKVHEKRLTTTQAANILGLSKRQVLRLSKTIKTQGDCGIISKKVGAPSNHQLPQEVKDQAVKIIFDNYRDFGPTLAHEYLTEKHSLSLSVSSVRNLMIKNEMWLSKRARKKRVFQLRPRRSKEGELIQVDGSIHDWFEGRGPYCTLLAFIDDATSKIMYLQFAKSESLASYFSATQEYIQKLGRPEAFYPDKHSVFRVNREGALSGSGLTQFGRAMEELDIQLICANTPQAKGRVERRHRDLQDRLIKAMRIQKIDAIEAANAFLPSFIEDFNKRFAKPPQESTNAHRPLLESQDLNQILCLKHKRHLSKNLTLQYNNIIYQIDTDRPHYALSKAEVTVLETMDGQVTIQYQGKPLRATPYYQMEAQTKIVSSKELVDTLDRKQEKRYRPGTRHPWKRGKRGFSNSSRLAGCC